MLLGLPERVARDVQPRGERCRPGDAHLRAEAGARPDGGGGMSTMTAPKVKVRGLTATDLKKGIAEIQGLDTVERWVRRGKPVEDIEMEIANVIKRAERFPGYQRMRESMCDKYKGMNEELLVRRLLTHMATS